MNFEDILYGRLVLFKTLESKAFKKADEKPTKFMYYILKVLVIFRFPSFKMTTFINLFKIKGLPEGIQRIKLRTP